MAGNQFLYAMVGSEWLVTAAEAVIPSRLPTSNIGEHTRSSVAEFLGVACVKPSASSLAGAWNRL